jgi:signal transduction histidine kinase
VQDDGCGIAPADQAQVFKPFFTTKPPGQGTGLGLAIAKTIVSEHEGDIQITSERGQGTRVTVLLPTLEAAKVAGAGQTEAAPMR